MNGTLRAGQPYVTRGRLSRCTLIIWDFLFPALVMRAALLDQSKLEHKLRKSFSRALGIANSSYFETPKRFWAVKFWARSIPKILTRSSAPSCRSVVVAPQHNTCKPFSSILQLQLLYRNSLLLVINPIVVVAENWNSLVGCSAIVPIKRDSKEAPSALYSSVPLHRLPTLKQARTPIPYNHEGTLWQ